MINGQEFPILLHKSVIDTAEKYGYVKYVDGELFVMGYWAKENKPIPIDYSR